MDIFKLKKHEFCYRHNDLYLIHCNCSNKSIFATKKRICPNCQKSFQSYTFYTKPEMNQSSNVSLINCDFKNHVLSVDFIQYKTKGSPLFYNIHSIEKEGAYIYEQDVNLIHHSFSISTSNNFVNSTNDFFILFPIIYSVAQDSINKTNKKIYESFLKEIYKHFQFEPDGNNISLDLYNIMVICFGISQYPWIKKYINNDNMQCFIMLFAMIFEHHNKLTIIDPNLNIDDFQDVIKTKKIYYKYQSFILLNIFSEYATQESINEILYGTALISFQNNTNLLDAFRHYNYINLFLQYLKNENQVFSFDFVCDFFAILKQIIYSLCLKQSDITYNKMKPFLTKYMKSICYNNSV